MADYNKLIEQIVNSGLVSKDNAWEFCDQLFQKINSITIEEHIKRIESATEFTEVTRTDVKNKREIADQQYLDNMQNGQRRLQEQKRK